MKGMILELRGHSPKIFHTVEFWVQDRRPDAFLYQNSIRRPGWAESEQ